MKLDLLEEVKRFHLKYGLGVSAIPTQPSDATKEHRINMIKEEGSELIEALEGGDFVKIGRECVDLIKVCIGTMLVYGLPFNNIWNAVMTANMKKNRAQGNTKASKPTKPPGWISPDRYIKSAIYAKLPPGSEAPLPNPEETAAGVTGASGDVGGAAGLSGESGSTGSTAENTGLTGTTGGSGSTGTTGSTGTSGSTGPAAPVNDQGTDVKPVIDDGDTKLEAPVNDPRPAEPVAESGASQTTDIPAGQSTLQPTAKDEVAADGKNGDDVAAQTNAATTATNGAVKAGGAKAALAAKAAAAKSGKPGEQ